ncbi:MAG: polyprenyl synthetase family protein [Bdellovibrionaceae bacterium]|nr:polyprenyl synthetase family protein [Pseudobdellovibrionaceae bacterium]
MNSYLPAQNSFEEFCRNEFNQLFQQTTSSVARSLNRVNAIQQAMWPLSESVPSATRVNSQFESIEYSFFSGGKRFRPLLAFAGGEYLDIPLESIFPWAMAIEMVHTYSLIHDDLPCMDNDDVRRGQPTNHKVYGQAIALLAGDSLVTEAFAVLGKHYATKGSVLALLTGQLAYVSGLNGMILGQYYDMTLDQSPSLATATHLNQIHLLKTGALISGALMGPAILKGLDEDSRDAMKDVGLLLGYAFQVKDDILDGAQDKDSKKNLIYHFGDPHKLEQFLNLIHQELESKIKALNQRLNISDQKNQILLQFLEWNIKRDK